MKKAIVVLVLGVTLTGCAQTINNFSVEAEAVGPIISRTVNALNDCLDYDNQKQCEEVVGLLEKHPWLTTPEDVRITNFNGMRQDEWDAQLMAFQKGIKTIKDLAPIYFEKMLK